jgi:hypothetical protein
MRLNGALAHFFVVVIIFRRYGSESASRKGGGDEGELHRLSVAKTMSGVSKGVKHPKV